MTPSSFPTDDATDQEEEGKPADDGELADFREEERHDPEGDGDGQACPGRARRIACHWCDLDGRCPGWLLGRSRAGLVVPAGRCFDPLSMVALGVGVPVDPGVHESHVCIV